MAERPTLKDVARKAGVSTGMAGRVLGNYGSYSEKTRRRVSAAARAVQYSPNVIARAWAAKGKLKTGDEFVHESIIGSIFRGRVERTATVGGKQGIVPSIEGWAKITGFNTIVIDDDDPFARGFQVM